MVRKTLFSFFTVLFIVFSQAHAASLSVSGLRCEYKVNPLGIDVMQPRLSWKLVSGNRDVIQSAWEIRTSHSLKGLTSGKDLLWSSGKVESQESAHVPWNGPGLYSSERIYWQVRVWDQHGKKSTWSTPAWFEMGLLSPDDWEAQWIRADIVEDSLNANPAHYYRGEFTSEKKILSARAYVTALGLYELHINGKRVGDAFFTPGWTSYNTRLQYQTYDVTSMVHQGKNAVGAIVGDGWYRGRIAWNGSRNKYGKQLGLLVQIKVDFDDGTSAWWMTNEHWKAATGPIRWSQIYDGETYDARLELDGWDNTGFDDESWGGVKTFSHDMEILVAQESEPVKKIEEVIPRKILITPAGDTVVDMGQNMVGWIRLKVSGPAGQKVVLRHAEVLDKEGNFYTENLRSAKQKITYILKGGETEVFEPHFTFQGFRYVAVSGFPGKLTPDNLTGIVLHTAYRETGRFECSDSLINRLYHNIVWGQKGNFLAVPTDCPQRDERLGWTGDAQVFAPTACFNADVASFYTRWMKDFTADQQAEGQIPHVIPDVLSINMQHIGSSASAGWADAAVIVPWTVYLAYGDKRILEQQYETMKRWVGYQEKQAGDSYFWKQDFTFGDWLAFNTTRSDYPGATTDKDFITQAYFARSVGLMERIAGILGKTDEREHYRSLLEKIKEVFRNEFLTPSGRLSPNTQTAYALALYLDLVPDELKESAASRLAEDVKKFGHLTTGFLGTPLLCPVLSDNGYTDVAYELLNRKQYPSWLYPVTMGATTIWERWDGIKPDSTFQDPGMNSFNHYAYGAIGEWMFRTIAGIQIDEDHPGYKHVVFAPEPGGGITHASASTESVYGRVGITWTTAGKKMNVEITVPPNTTASLVLPGASIKGIILDGKPVDENKWVRNLHQDGDGVSLETGSGKYRFSYTPVEK